MNNAIANLYQKKAEKDAELAKIQTKIDELKEQRERVRERQKNALASRNNAEYLAAFRELKDIETDIEGNESLLHSKTPGGFSVREVIDAWEQTCSEYKKDRQKLFADYEKAKSQLKEKYLELYKGDQMLKSMRDDAMGLTDPPGAVFLSFEEFDNTHAGNLYFKIS